LRGGAFEKRLIHIGFNLFNGLILALISPGSNLKADDDNEQTKQIAIYINIIE
jgi:hypothetical protein